MVTSAIRVACVGAGYFSQFHVDAWERIAETHLCGICDRSQDCAAATAVPAFSDLTDMLGSISPDLLDIITPPSTHVATIERAIDHGVKVIICQKPFCENLAQAKSVAARADQAGVTLIIHENFRFQPWFRSVRRLLDEQALGRVCQARFSLRTGDGQGPDAYMDRQPYFQTMQQLLIHETGVHYLDTFCFLFGQPIAVYADLRRLNPVIAGEDAGLFVLDFPDEVRAVFDGNRNLDFSAENPRLTFGELLVEGCEASLKLYGDGRLTQRQFGSRRERTVLEPKRWKGFAGDSVYALNRHVVEHLLYGTKLENTAQRYLRVLQLEQMVYEAATTGRKLAVDAKTA